MQSGIPIRGGARYRFTGWVKAENVKGRAGWFVHVHGRGKLLLNRTTGEGGTFGWRKIAPDVPIYSSTWSYIDGLEDHITLWGIGIHGSFPQEKVDARRAEGDRFWYTTDIMPDPDAVLAARVAAGATLDSLVAGK